MKAMRVLLPLVLAGAVTPAFRFELEVPAAWQLRPGEAFEAEAREAPAEQPPGKQP